ncbi:MAG: MoaD/ThiS family protein, partial [Acidobacteriota bacterium]|nr:MoaD/ThiS family protein [Acidobacteriota bacterium]
MTDAGANRDAESKTVSVRLLLFGAAREAAGGRGECEIEVGAPATAARVLEEAAARFPALARFGRSLLVAVNEEYATPDRAVRDGDEVAIFPPVSGGEGGAQDFFELTTEPIDVGEIARRVVAPRCGATVTLDGYVREWTRG